MPRLRSTLPTACPSFSVPASKTVLFGGMVGPSDTLRVLPIVNWKLLWPNPPLASHAQLFHAPRTPAVADASVTSGWISGRNPTG